MVELRNKEELIELLTELETKGELKHKTLNEIRAEFKKNTEIEDSNIRTCFTINFDDSNPDSAMLIFSLEEYTRIKNTNDFKIIYSYFGVAK